MLRSMGFTCVGAPRAPWATVLQPGAQHGEGLHVPPLVLCEALARAQHREEVSSYCPIHFSEWAGLQDRWAVLSQGSPFPPLYPDSTQRVSLPHLASPGREETP